MSPAFNGSSALEHFERSNEIEIHNGIMFDFYPGLPHMYIQSANAELWGSYTVDVSIY